MAEKTESSPLNRLARESVWSTPVQRAQCACTSDTQYARGACGGSGGSGSTIVGHRQCEHSAEYDTRRLGGLHRVCRGQDAFVHRERDEEAEGNEPYTRHEEAHDVPGLQHTIAIAIRFPVEDLLAHPARYPTRHGIPPGTLSHPARYPIPHGIPSGTVRRTASSYPRRTQCRGGQARARPSHEVTTATHQRGRSKQI